MSEYILKDSRGKEQTFSDDKIFVQGTDGELVQFTMGTGDVPAVLQDKTITENGTYSADSGYDGLGSVTVDVAGAGGGLEPGGYWTQKSLRPVYSYAKRRVTLNGVDYLINRNSSGSGSSVNVYKIENGVYTMVTSSATCYCNHSSMNAVELNGVLHLIDSSASYHHVFNGTTITKKENLPSSANGICAFVHNNELYCHMGNDGFYKWDESTDSWSLTYSIVPEKYSSYWVFWYNGNYYMMTKKNLYRIYLDESTFELVKTLAINSNIPASNVGFVLTQSGILYFIAGTSNTSGASLYKYDITNDVLTYLCELPYMGAVGLYIENGNICILDNGSSSKTDLVLHEVTE